MIMCLLWLVWEYFGWFIMVGMDGCVVGYVVVLYWVVLVVVLGVVYVGLEIFV